jgi:putative endonuclease
MKIDIRDLVEVVILESNRCFLTPHRIDEESGGWEPGITNDLVRRVHLHKCKSTESFTKRYNITRLVYFESTDDVTVAIAREKQIKGLLRNKKIELIKTLNPEWKDLSEDWYDLNSKK